MLILLLKHRTTNDVIFELSDETLSIQEVLEWENIRIEAVTLQYVIWRRNKSEILEHLPSWSGLLHTEAILRESSIVDLSFS